MTECKYSEDNTSVCVCVPYFKGHNIKHEQTTLEIYAIYVPFQTEQQTCVYEKVSRHTQIQGCLRASAAVMRLAGFIVSILLIRSLASGVTVSHSGEGN